MKLANESCVDCRSNSVHLVCKESECDHLCYHMYHCDNLCYDYSNGHICKHIHRVHSLRLSLQGDDVGIGRSAIDQDLQFSLETDSEDDPLEFAESIRNATGM